MLLHQYSVERLVHFQCGLCQKWWTVADAPERPNWTCPWCDMNAPTTDITPQQSVASSTSGD